MGASSGKRTSTTPAAPSSGVATRGSTGASMATEVRSTLIATSLQMLRERGLLERYWTLLAPAYRDAIAQLVPGTWVPATFVVAHFEACDRLGSTQPELVDLGRELTRRLHSPLVDLAARVAGAAGVSPWILASQLPRFWGRMYRGGGMISERAGTNAADITVFGFPCAHITYNRIAFRGVLLAGAERLSKRVVVQEIGPRCTATTLAYHMLWA